MSKKFKSQLQQSGRLGGFIKVGAVAATILTAGLSFAEEKIEKFQVTGSHIKRIDIEGPSPVTVIDSKALERSGHVSVADVLRDNNASSFGGFKEQSGSNAAGVAHVNLRGLGSQRTLVLLDGRRLPADAVTGAPDLNLIPLAAVDRIEILKDGASATYGSDALGGVVNIITKSDFNGMEVGYKTFKPELKGGQKSEFSAVSGTSNAKSSMTTVLNYRKSEMIYDKDREWSKGGTSLIGSPGSYKQNGSDDAEFIADPNCPSESLKPGPGGNFCTYDFSVAKSMIPSLENLGLLTSLRYELTDETTAFARIGAARKRTNWVYAAAPGSFSIPAAAADKLGPGGGSLPGVDPGSDITARYRLTELGNRVSDVETTSFSTLGGLKGVLAGKWDWEVAVLENRVRRFDLGTSGYALTRTLNELIESGDFNPFGKPGERGDLGTAKFQPWEKAVTVIKQADAKVSGEIFDLPGGSAAIAFGVITRSEQFTDTLDEQSVQGQAYGSAGSNGAGARKTKSIYSELAMPVLESLEVQLAARYDEYSDFGESSNPKVAVRYQPIDSLAFRASAGTGFKAPSLVDLYAASSEGYPSFVDHVACEKEKAEGEEGTPSCTEAQYKVLSGGNPGLKEEKSESFNIGVMFQPTSSFNLGLDFWTVKLDNVVSIDYSDLTKAESEGVDVTKNGVEIKRDNNGYIDEITAPLQNLASREVSGIDFHLDFTLATTPIGKFIFRTDHSHLFHYKEEGFPGAGFVDKLGEKGLPAWRNASTFLFNPQDHEISFTARTIAGQKKEDKEMGDLPDYVEWDTQYAYSAKWSGKFIVGAKNVFGAEPPRDDSTPNEQVNADLYDQVGRTYYAGYTQLF